MEDKDVLDVLRAFPRIYLACHVKHRTRSKSPSGLTERDASLLAHIEDGGEQPGRACAPRRHFAIDLSAGLGRLTACSLVRLERVDGDGRKRKITLTPDGIKAISRDSVLDPHRVAQLLGRLRSGDRRRAVDGLKLLAEASRDYEEDKG